MYKISKLLAVIIILAANTIVNAQTPNLRSLSNYALFTDAGALTNTGISQITGNIGTKVGAISGYDAPSKVIGDKHIADAATLQAGKDLDSLLSALALFTVTNSTHNAVFGNGETLQAGVYSIGSAGSLSGNLILDANNDPNALFIIKMGGALNSSPFSTVNFINGTKASNVFWVLAGAISLSASTIMKGTVIGNSGAGGMGANCKLEGRLFSIAGAISTADNNVVCLPVDAPKILITDIAPTIYFLPNSVIGKSTINLITSLGEFNNVPTNGLITIKILKSNQYPLTFDPSATIIAKQPVNNAAWTFDNSDPVYYIFTTSNVISGNGDLAFGLSGIFDPNSTKGVSSVTATLTAGSGGKINTTNNSNTALIQYSF